jgi:predicted  nucleic acid-binding Zn-ribbon protein
LSEKLKKRFEDFEKEDVEIRESIKHSKDSIKKLEKNIETESDKVQPPL